MKEGWTYKKLGEVCEKSKNIRWEDIEEDKSFSYIDLTSVDRETLSIKGPQLITKANAPSRAKQIVKEGDILFATTRPTLKRVCLIPPSFDNQICSTGFCVLRPKADVDSKWIYFLLQDEKFYHYIEPLQTGASYPAVTDTIVKEYPIHYPPLSEQQSIVDYLDSVFAKIDGMKANAEKALNEAKALFQASLKEMLEPKEGWEEKMFGKICDFVRGPFGGSLKKECFKDSGYAVYEQQNAIYNKFCFRYYIDEEKYRSLIRFKINAGDLIMSCSGTIGKVAIIPEDCKEGIINQALLKLTPKKEIDAHFLKYLMESKYFEEIINANIEGVAIKNIASVAVLKAIKLYIPKISEQLKIVLEIDSLKSKVDRLQENFDKISQECDALKQAILRQVFE